MRSSFSISLLYHAYVYLEFLILACTIYILAPDCGKDEGEKGVTEQLKAENQMLWVGKMNNIIACAEAVVVREVVYV